MDTSTQTPQELLEDVRGNLITADEAYIELISRQFGYENLKTLGLMGEKEFEQLNLVNQALYDLTERNTPNL